MDITIKTKFDKGDRVIVKTADEAEKLVVFVLAEVMDIKQITRSIGGFNRIMYELKTFKIGECYAREILTNEDMMFTLDDFSKFFNTIFN